jgi:hypothetical protein
MYEVAIDEDNKQVVITGPGGFERSLPQDGFGIVLRSNVEDEWDDVPRRYVVPIATMTKVELIACALEMFAYPL